MPRSKRAKLVSLTKTTKNVGDLKTRLVDNIRESVDLYSRLFLFSFENMRTAQFKEVRGDWTDSRFFLGKNKVMRVALGKSEDDEYRDGLAELAAGLSGNVGLLFTNRSQAEVTEYFAKLAVQDFARSGAPATDTVVMQAGPLTEMAHTMVEPLRKLGMPVALDMGVVKLETDYTVCKEGDALTPDQARILKLFGVQMSEFRITPIAMWSDGVVTDLTGEEKK